MQHWVCSEGSHMATCNSALNIPQALKQKQKTVGKRKEVAASTRDESSRAAMVQLGLNLVHAALKASRAEGPLQELEFDKMYSSGTGKAGKASQNHCGSKAMETSKEKRQKVQNTAGARSMPGSVEKTTGRPPHGHLLNAAGVMLRRETLPPDELRCTMNDGKRSTWRCTRYRAGGIKYCEVHAKGKKRQREDMLRVGQMPAEKEKGGDVSHDVVAPPLQAAQSPKAGEMKDIASSDGIVAQTMQVAEKKERALTDIVTPGQVSESMAKLGFQLKPDEAQLLARAAASEITSSRPFKGISALLTATGCFKSCTPQSGKATLASDSLNSPLSAATKSPRENAPAKAKQPGTSSGRSSPKVQGRRDKDRPSSPSFRKPLSKSNPSSPIPHGGCKKSGPVKSPLGRQGRRPVVKKFSRTPGVDAKPGERRCEFTGNHKTWRCSKGAEEGIPWCAFHRERKGKKRDLASPREDSPEKRTKMEGSCGVRKPTLVIPPGDDMADFGSPDASVPKTPLSWATDVDASESTGVSRRVEPDEDRSSGLIGQGGKSVGVRCEFTGGHKKWQCRLNAIPGSACCAKHSSIKRRMRVKVTGSGGASPLGTSLLLGESGEGSAGSGRGVQCEFKRELDTLQCRLDAMEKPRVERRGSEVEAPKASTADGGLRHTSETLARQKSVLDSGCLALDDGRNSMSQLGVGKVEHGVAEMQERVEGLSTEDTRGLSRLESQADDVVVSNEPVRVIDGGDMRLRDEGLLCGESVNGESDDPGALRKRDGSGVELNVVIESSKCLAMEGEGRALKESGVGDCLEVERSEEVASGLEGADVRKGVESVEAC